MAFYDIFYAIWVYISGLWNATFSTSSDNGHLTVYRVFQQPVFSYSIGGIPLYAYIMILLTTGILAIITIMEKGVIPGVTAPPGAEPSPPSSISQNMEDVEKSPESTVGGRRKKRRIGKH